MILSSAPKYFALDIRPKFFRNVRRGVEADGDGSPSHCIHSAVGMSRKPGIRNKGGAITAAHFRKIEHPAARILVGEKGLANRATNAGPNCRLVRRVECWTQPKCCIETEGE